jgi:ribonuclease VapC
VIIDTSAVLAILFQEADAPQYAQAIAMAQVCRMSAANYLEAALNVDHHGDREASRQLDVFIERAQVHIEAVTFEQVRIARQAYLDYGKGHHPAGLNFGDVFAYALSKSTGEPLLYKGGDFGQTDIAAVPVP